MECFDKRMALAVIEDALTNIDTQHGRGVATGLCGAFYMCGLLNEEEWGELLGRIPVEPYKTGANGMRRIKSSGASGRGRFLN